MEARLVCVTKRFFSRFFALLENDMRKIGMRNVAAYDEAEYKVRFFVLQTVNVSS